MIRFLTSDEVTALHARLIASSGGSAGLRDRHGLESAVAQPRMTFGGEDLYESVVDKAAALGFTLIANHPFVDGNKRIGHASMETFLLLNGFEVYAEVDEQEQVILSVAAGTLKRQQFTEWLRTRVRRSDRSNG